MLLEMIPESKAKKLITLVPFHLNGDIPTLIDVITKSRNSSLKTKSKKDKTKSEKAKNKKKAKHDSTPSYSGPVNKHFIAACSSTYCSIVNGKSTWNLGRVT